MDKSKYNNIPKEKFQFVGEHRKLSDVKFSTKPVGYFKDAFRRFTRNKASVAGAIIILIIALYALITPLISPYSVSYSDPVYKSMVPKNDFLANFGIAKGTIVMQLNDRYYAYMLGIGVAIADSDGTGKTWQDGEAEELSPVVRVLNTYDANGVRYREVEVDAYLAVGFKYENVSEEKRQAILDWEAETGIQVIYPMVRNSASDKNYDPNDANMWYITSASNMTPYTSWGITARPIDMETENLVDNYIRNADGDVMYFRRTGTAGYQVRVLYYNYYRFMHDGNTPSHLFGTDAFGYDIFVRLAAGVTLSLMLAMFVSAINLSIGTIYGAIEGYYGGTTDLIMERITDILGGIPFYIVITLFQMHYAAKVGSFVSLLLAFVVVGWLGTAYRVRTQFYRFKNQEYILAARTLGAKDMRLMFKHIFPNSLGTIITSSVLVIPFVIFSESSLSYLGIINLTGATGTSLGTMLAEAQQHLERHPHMILFPGIIISLLMISFNLFGNGLRDAFNPSLRGAEE